MKKKLLTITSFLLLSIACFAQKEVVNKPGINLQNMDKTKRPQDDFYNYVNGGWMAKTTIPADKATWGGFSQLRETTDSVALQILKKSMNATHTAGSEEQKVSDLYASIMDTVARNKSGLSPIMPYLQKIDDIQNLADLQKYFTEMTPYGGANLYAFGVSASLKNSNEYAVYMGDIDLGMGRDYYQKTDDNSKEKLAKYQTYIAEMLTAIGEKDAANKAVGVLNFEKTMANTLLPLEKIRNAQLQNNPIAVKDLNKLVPNLDLQAYLMAFNIKQDTVIVPELKYYQELSKNVNESNLGVIKDYLKFQLINSAAGMLSLDMEQKKFSFYSTQLQGVKQMRARDKRALGTINGAVGEALGKLYVAEVFPPAAKAAAKDLIAYLMKSYEVHIKNLNWMSAETKEKALVKLAKINVKIGYPDKWKDYSGLIVFSPKTGGSYFGNMMNHSRWHFNENLSKLGKPVDKTEWGMSPQTVNAYYRPQFNEIVFPAAILQAPFYDYKADPAVNFGGIGAVIGHEVSHGFDDSGAQFDADGNLKNWWSAEDSKKFAAAGEALAKQYSSYEPFPGIFVNGKFTLGENIGDLGGVNVSFDALQLYLKDHKGIPNLIDGFTQDQRFFLSWATVWRTKIRDEAMKNQVKTDPHAPGFYRAIGPISNVNSFFKAFNIKEGDKMYKAPADRIVIW